MLQCVLAQGMILKKIHRVLQFNQSKWLRPYIELNTKLRTKAKNDFEKNFFKLLCNAIYGKTMENLRLRSDIKLKTYWEGRYGARKLISLPNFKKSTIFDENLVAIEMNKTNILMNKPIAIGMSILDLSKVLMYDFHYNHMKLKYGENIIIVYTDTDSLVYEIKTDCFYNDMKESLELYDTSDYPKDNIFGIPQVNKKIPGLFKDELNSQIFTEFVGLRSKMYSIKADTVKRIVDPVLEIDFVKKAEGVDKMKKAKGVKRYVLNNKIEFSDYYKCIKDNSVAVREQNGIRSKNHRVFTVQQTKVALSPFDNKRKILDNNIDTLPWGHYTLLQ